MPTLLRTLVGLLALVVVACHRSDGSAPLPIDNSLTDVNISASTNVVANGVDNSTITVTLIGLSGEPLAGYRVQLSSSGSDNVFVPASGTTDASGVFQAELSTTSAELKTLLARVSFGGSVATLPERPTIQFIGDSATIDGALSMAEATPAAGVVADGTALSTVTVTVRDINGNGVPGQTVAIASDGTNNTVVQPAGPTDIDGRALATLATTTAELKTITATIDPSGAAVVVTDRPTVAFQGDPANISAALSSVAATPTTGVIADGMDTTTLSATIRDINGNLVPGVAVAFAATGTDNTLTQPAAVTDENGVTSGTLASLLAETKTISATVDPAGSAILLDQTPAVTFAPDPSNLSATLSTVVANPTSGLTADGTATSTITITVRDVNGNPVSGIATAIASSGTGNTLVQPGATDGSGVTTATLRSTVAETKTLTVTLVPGAGDIVLAAQPTVTFDPDPDNLSASLSTAVANPTFGLPADGASLSTITVVARDANGNPVPGVSVSLASTGTGNTISPAVATTNGAGTATITLASTQAETKTLTVTLDPGGDDVVLTTNPTVSFDGNPNDLSASLSSASASPASNIDANGTSASTITVTVRDSNGNTVSGQTVQVAASGTGNILTQPSGPTDAMGVATATLASTVVETKTVTVTLNPGGTPLVLDDTPTVGFVTPAPDPDNSSVVASPDFGALADGLDVVTVTVTVRDGSNQALAGQTVTIAATGSGNTIVQPGAVTDAAGVATATLSSTFAEIKTLTATVNPGAGEVRLNQQATAELVWPVPNALFVRITGSDTASGTSPGRAFRTLGRAEMSAASGETVYVGAGTYTESVELTSGGAAGSPIRWLADTDGTFTGDAGEVILDAGGADYALRLTGAGEIDIEGFTIIGSSTLTVGAVDVTGPATTARITRNRIYDNALGVRVSGASGALIEDNSLSNNTGAGARLEAGANGTVFRNNLVYNNGGAGFEVDASTGALADLNTFYLNGADQVIAENGATLAANSNVLAMGLADGFEQASGAAITSTFNDSFGHAGANWAGLSPDASDISVDPMFDDPDGTDDLLGGAEGLDDRFQVDETAPSATLDAGSGNASAVVLASGETASDRGTRSDELLDGELPDGAALNMGYHYAPIIEPLTPLAAGDGRLFYGEGASSRPRVRTWDDSLTAWTVEQPTVPAATRIQYAVHDQSPLDDGREYLMVQSLDGSDAALEMLAWNGASWVREWSSTDITSTHADKRGFDLGFESASSHGLAVYTNDTMTPRFRTLEQGVWSDEAALPLNDGAGPNADPNSGVVLWLELISRPDTDEVTLLYADDNSDLVAITWDGAQWLEANATLLETNTKTNPISGFVHSRTFDGAYERLSGDFLVAWGREGAQGFFFAERPLGSNTYTGAANINAPNNGVTHYMDLAPEEGTDRIAGGAYDLGDGTERLGLAMWNGTAWQDVVEIDSQTLDVNDMGMSDFPGEVAWVGSSGEAVVVYADNQSGTIDWATWSDGSGWSLGADVSIPGKGTGESAFLATFPGQNRVMLVLSDSNADLYAATYDGTSWSLTNGGAPLETELSVISAAPFSFAFGVE